MSQPKKRKIVTQKLSESSKDIKSKSGKKAIPTVSKLSKSASRTASIDTDMLFGRENYKWILIGVACVALGMLLMVGGNMPSPDVWDESLIYSFRRTVLAPFVIIIGLVVVVYAILRNK